MAIPEDIIERVRLSSDIISIVREYLPDLKRAGRNWKACCPFHNEKTPSFVVSPEKGIFRCFGCNAAGDVFKFVMLMDNLSWIESVKKLAKKAGIEIKETKQDIVKVSEKTKLFNILDSAANFYHRYLLESDSAKKAKQYLEKRGITLDTIKKFKLGYAPKNMLIQQALKKGNTTTDLSKAGLITKTERGTFFEYMSERVVFPIFDVQGRVVAFGGRTLGEQNPKYLNTPETVIYSKSSNLYGLFQTLPELRKERKITVLEGYMDVVIPQQFGIVGAVASLGTAFTQNHAKLIARYADSVTLLFDADDAGRTATQRALEILVENSTECVVSSLPEKVDADEFLNKYGKDEFIKLINESAQSAIDFMINRVSFIIKGNSSEAKAKKVNFLLDFISKSSNSIVQREWIKKISQSLNIDEEAVWREFKKKKAGKYKAADSRVNIENKQTVKATLTLEENLLNLILSDRSFVEKTSQECFEDERCLKVYGMAVSGLRDDEILSSLSKEDSDWFTAVTLDAIEYKDFNEAHSILIKDIETKKLNRKKKELEKEILLMTEGKKIPDNKIIDEYKKIITQLKGSGK